MQFKILNAREVKKLVKRLEEDYKAKNLKLDYIFLKNNENKIFILSKDFKDLDTSKLKMNNLGVYFCKKEGNSFRLTIEGSQLVGKNSEKVIDLDSKEIKQWVRGDNIKKEVENGTYFIIRHDKDFYGVGKVKDNILKNFIPKHRMIKK